MTQILWAVEAFRKDEWELLPNTIMVDRRSAQFEMDCLRKDARTQAPTYREKYRIVSYERQEPKRITKRMAAIIAADNLCDSDD